MNVGVLFSSPAARDLANGTVTFPFHPTSDSPNTALTGSLRSPCGQASRHPFSPDPPWHLRSFPHSDLDSQCSSPQPPLLLSWSLPGPIAVSPMLVASQSLCWALPLLSIHLEHHPHLRLQGPVSHLPSAPDPIIQGRVLLPQAAPWAPQTQTHPRSGHRPPPPTACLHSYSHSTLPFHRPVRSRFLAPWRREETGLETGRPGPRDGSARLRCTARVGRRMGQSLPPLTPRPPGAGAVNVVDQIDSHHAWKSAVSC